MTSSDASTGEPRALLRQERSRETRRRLVEAAGRLWREKGYDETSVDEICHAAGVAKGTFYFHFPQKEDLLSELALAEAHALSDKLMSELDDSAETTEALVLRIVHELAVEAERTHRRLLARSLLEVFRSVERPEPRQVYSRLFAAVFKRARDRGEVPPGASVRELSSVTTLLVLHGMLTWANGRTRSVALEDLLAHRVRLVLAGTNDIDV